MLFKATKDLGSKKKKPSVSDTVEDILLKRKLQRSENAWKVCLHINRSYWTIQLLCLEPENFLLHSLHLDGFVNRIYMGACFTRLCSFLLLLWSVHHDMLIFRHIFSSEISFWLWMILTKENQSFHICDIIVSKQALHIYWYPLF